MVRRTDLNPVAVVDIGSNSVRLVVYEGATRAPSPLFNEKAYKILVNQGQQDRADRFLYNKPETVLTMTLKGPGASTQAAIDAFNEVFGA